MAFNAILQTSENVVTITLAGELDAASANQFKSEVEAAVRLGATRLVLAMHHLEYMASAGLRVLIFAKQKMGADVDIYVVGAQPSILSTLEKTGFDRSVYVVTEYPPAT